MKVSILIAVKGSNERLEECLARCLRLTYRDVEILALPDTAFDYPDARVRIIPTGPCLPAKKRDVGARLAQGEILAFLDDDAYPAEGWLEPAIEIFKSDPQVAAVGGPAVTPPDEPFWRKAGGLVYESAVLSGIYRYRYLPRRQRLMDDHPSCNLLVRKEVFLKLKGFDTVFWPGEDTVLCLKIVKELGQKIIYDPRVLVYHHRRPLFGPHLLQIASYAKHRGYFAKRFPQTSRRWSYFMPTLLIVSFVAFLLVFLLSLFVRGLFFPTAFFLAFLGTYVLAVFLGSLHGRRLGLIALTILGIVASHLTYGFCFAWGGFARRLKEEI